MSKTDPIWTPDATSIATFREDPEAFRLKYRKHLRAPGWNEAPDSGSAFHKALQVWFDQRDSDLTESLRALRAAWGEPEHIKSLFGVPSPNAPKVKRPLELFERLLKGYAQRWPRETEAFEIVRNEAYIDGKIMPTASGLLLPDHRTSPDSLWLQEGQTVQEWRNEIGLFRFRWCGVIDRKIRTSDGCEYVMDTKTTSAWLNDDYFAAFRLGVQLPGYVGLELVNGRRCDGYYIDAVQVDTRYHKVNPDKFVRHGPVKLAAWELSRWARDVEHTLNEIRRLDEERGPNEPWPIYANFKFGRVKNHEFYEFFTQPPELHPQIALGFEEKRWDPSAK